MPPPLAPKTERRLDRLIAALVARVRKSAWLVVAVAFAAAAAAGVYAARNLGMNTDTADMISPDLPFRQATKAFDQAFPQFADLLVVVVEADTPDRAEAAADALAAALKTDKRLFRTVYRPGGEPFFRRNGLLYLDRDELDRLADNLARVQPLLFTLAADPSLRGLFGLLETSVKALIDGEAPAYDLGAAFNRLSDAVEAELGNRPYHLSWQEVISGETADAAARRRLILVQPQLDFRAILPQKAALEAVRATAKRLTLTEENGYRVRLTGSVALDFDQIESARIGVGIAAPVSFVLVTFVLWMGLRSVRLMLASLATLIVGFLLTAGFATAVVGELNLVSVAFAVLFIGLGIDFSIHLALRYREIVALGGEDGRALDRAAVDVGRALVLCAATTAVGFYVFIPTAYRGVAELGLIAGTGMFIALAVNLVVLPAILTIAPLRAARPLSRRWWNIALDRIAERRKLVRTGAIIVGLSVVALAPLVRFNVNPLDLHDGKVESVRTLRDLLADPKLSPWSLNALRPDLAQANALAARLRKLAEVDDARTIADFVPPDQEEKLATIEEIGLFLGPPPGPDPDLPPEDERARRAALESLSSTLAAWRAAGGPSGALAPAAARLARALDRLAASGRPLDGLERSLLDGFDVQLKRLYDALAASEPVTLENLPESLRERMIAKDGRVRIQILPRDDLADNDAMRRFVDAVRSVAPDAVGAPVSILESGDAVVRAFQQALASAVLATVLLLLALTRRLRETLLVLAPLALAAAITGAASVLFDIPFNFANVIVLPLLFGIGVDSAIHLVLRAHGRNAGEGRLLETSTARGIVYSGLTTICSFGSLMLSPHRGTASMGSLLAIGIAATLVSALIVLPALLPAWRKNGEGRNASFGRRLQ